MGDIHRALVLSACRWLSKTKKCHRVFAEVNSMKLDELPDAIGYRFSRQWGTTVIEAKASVADFKRDASKRWKQMEALGDSPSMGTWRYYITPEGLIPLADIPADHGLLYMLPSGRVKCVREAPRRAASNAQAELCILHTMLQRYELGCQWIPGEYRFETERERKARSCAGMPLDQKEEADGQP